LRCAHRHHGRHRQRRYQCDRVPRRGPGRQLGARPRPEEAHWQAPKTTWAQADVAQDDLVPHLRDADALIHLAWLFQPTHDPIVTWRSNVDGSIRVFDAAVEAGVRTIVYASSVGAHSPGPKDRAVDESWPTHGWPAAGYTREKAYVERVLDAFERDHPRSGWSGCSRGSSSSARRRPGSAGSSPDHCSRTASPDRA
jgi:nucleoside-diphosphate-sugar epimerase